MDERSRSPLGTLRLTAMLLVAGVAAGQAGCSLFVMAGKAMLGDPLQPAPFTTATRVDLLKEDKQVIVVCSTPESVKTDFPSLDFDLLDQIARELKSHNVQVVRPDDVATWMDNNGGYTDDPQQIADNFDADIIVHVDLNRFSFVEENSPTFFRGRAKGNIHAYQVVKGPQGTKSVQQIYLSEYNSTYPKMSPVSTQTMNEKTFRKRYVHQVSTEIAQVFYSHHAADELE
jgi:hypothetical protein